MASLLFTFVFFKLARKGIRASRLASAALGFRVWADPATFKWGDAWAYINAIVRFSRPECDKPLMGVDRPIEPFGASRRCRRPTEARNMEKRAQNTLLRQKLGEIKERASVRFERPMGLSGGSGDPQVTRDTWCLFVSTRRGCYNVCARTQ